MSPPVTVRVRPGVPVDDAMRAAAEATARAVQQALPRKVPLQLTVNANRRTMVSTRRHGRSLRISVHWAIVSCTKDLVAFVIHQDRSVLPALMARCEPGRPRPQQRLRTAGTHHDLAELLAQVQAEAFETLVPARITWGRRGQRPRRARRRSLRFGSRDETGLVRIHPVLDDPSVPAWFLRFVIFHELLHAVHPPEPSPSGRRRLHPPAFRAAERAHPDHPRAQAWQAVHLDRLIRRS